MTKWEYKILWQQDSLLGSLVEQQVRLNELGEDGWELVSVIHDAKWEFTTKYFKKEVDLEEREEREAIAEIIGKSLSGVPITDE